MKKKFIQFYDEHIVSNEVFTEIAESADVVSMKFLGDSELIASFERYAATLADGDEVNLYVLNAVNKMTKKNKGGNKNEN